jgi:hypothetical protein
LLGCSSKHHLCIEVLTNESPLCDWTIVLNSSNAGYRQWKCFFLFALGIKCGHDSCSTFALKRRKCAVACWIELILEWELEVLHRNQESPYTCYAHSFVVLPSRDALNSNLCDFLTMWPQALGEPTLTPVPPKDEGYNHFKVDGWRPWLCRYCSLGWVA